MAMKKMRVTLEIDVEDLPEGVRQEHAQQMDIPVNELGSVAETDARTAAAVFNDCDGAGLNDLLFEGTDIFVQFANIRVVDAGYV